MNLSKILCCLSLGSLASSSLWAEPIPLSQFTPVLPPIIEIGVSPYRDMPPSLFLLSKHLFLENQSRTARFWEEHRSLPITQEHVLDLYKQAEDFRLVQSLIGNTISEDESKEIGKIRLKIFEETTQELVKAELLGSKVGIVYFGPSLQAVDAQLPIHFTLISDNQSLTGKEMVAGYRTLFQHVSEAHGVKLLPEQLGIIPHRFEATTPDWRQQLQAAAFTLKFKERSLEGVYTSEFKTSLNNSSKTVTWYELNNKQLVKREVPVTEETAFFYHPDTWEAYAWATAISQWHFYYSHLKNPIAQAKTLLKSTDGTGLLLGSQKRGSFADLPAIDQEAITQSLYANFTSEDELHYILATLQTAVHLSALSASDTSQEKQLEAYAPLIQLEKKHPLLLSSSSALLSLAQEEFSHYGQRLLIYNNLITSQHYSHSWFDDAYPALLPALAFFELNETLPFLTEKNLSIAKTFLSSLDKESTALIELLQNKKGMLGVDETTMPARQKAAQKFSIRLQELATQLDVSEEPLNSAEFNRWLELSLITRLNLAHQEGYLPVLRQMQKDPSYAAQALLTPKQLVLLNSTEALIEILKAYLREGAIQDQVLKSALYEDLDFIPGFRELYTLQGTLEKSSSILMTRLIPGHGQINLTFELTDGSYVIKPQRGFPSLEKEFLADYQQNAPSLLLPLSPKPDLSLEEQRAHVYDYFHKQILELMKSAPTVWYTEAERPREWQVKEFDILKQLIKQYLQNWNEGRSPFKTPQKAFEPNSSLQAMLTKQLINDYITGKNIAIEESIHSYEMEQTQLMQQFFQIARLELFLTHKEEAFKENFIFQGQHLLEDILNEMPEIAPYAELVATPKMEQTEPNEPLNSKWMNASALFYESSGSMPQPWQISWQVDSEIKPGHPFNQEGAQATILQPEPLSLVVSIHNDEGKVFNTIALPLEIGSSDSLQLSQDLSSFLNELAVIKKEATTFAEIMQTRCLQQSTKIEPIQAQITEFSKQLSTYSAIIKSSEKELEELEKESISLDKMQETFKEVATAFPLLQEKINTLASLICTKVESISANHSNEEITLFLKDLKQLKEELIEQHKTARDEIVKAQMAVRKIQHSEDLARTLLNTLNINRSELVQLHGKVDLSQEDISLALTEIGDLEAYSHTLQEMKDWVQSFFDRSEGFKDKESALKELLSELKSLKNKIKECPRKAQELLLKIQPVVKDLSKQIETVQLRFTETQDQFFKRNLMIQRETLLKTARSELFKLELQWELMNERLREAERCEKMGYELGKVQIRIKMPDLQGKSALEATNLLTALKLKVNRVNGHPAPTQNLSSTIESQDPEPGTELKPGDVVTITIYEQYSTNAPST